jgi:outer membrane lipoprotein LolB
MRRKRAGHASISMVQLAQGATRFAALLFLGVALLLGGCSTAPPPVSDSAMETARAKLRSVQAFTFRGRLAFRYEETNYPTTFVWEYGKQSERIELKAPLGQGWLTLTRTPHDARLKTSTGIERHEARLEPLLRDMIGFEVPVQSLRFWMVGMPSPDAPYEAESNESGLYSELLQQGWRVVFRNYEMHDELWLPRRVTATRENLEVRSIISERTLLFSK